MVPKPVKQALTESAAKRKLPRIIAALQSAYGRPEIRDRKDPLSELIFTILSQNTSDLNRDRAWASLRRYRARTTD